MFMTGSSPDVLAFDEGLRRLYVSAESGDVAVFAEKGRSLRKLGQAHLADAAHTVAVDPKTLPLDLKPTAHTSDGILMGLRHREFPIHGVQFHPESIATEHGHAMLANFLKICGIEAKVPA